ncbi:MULTISPECIES: hypothetical protein [Pseudomonas]|uniref:hypothetical protein n=1 Tax=Pseudomonas TaxID=286 RepID=UPI0025A9C95B|nr:MULTISPECIES: hypothetical protein [Pseudomonas]MDM9596961.1 hypothetical protein [Pseudomonas shirazica]MDO2416364.1 hypothetical protein [Pseudomonas shirazica]MDS9588929.1 hypothetical protein [Pseudomonas sp. HTZ1]
MSLLSDLLNHMPPNDAGAGKPPMAKRAPDRPRLVLFEPAPLSSSPYANAANATAEWRQARDQYISHVMTCRGCYAPAGRHCLIGADLRATYDNTPMEAHP